MGSVLPPPQWHKKVRRARPQRSFVYPTKDVREGRAVVNAQVSAFEAKNDALIVAVGSAPADLQGRLFDHYRVSFFP